MNEHRCEKLIHSIFSLRGNPCKRPAKYFENGKHWCGIHAPSQIEARRQKKKDRKQAKIDKLHADPEFVKGRISLCKARIEASERELAEWESKLTALEADK